MLREKISDCPKIASPSLGRGLQSPQSPGHTQLRICVVVSPIAYSQKCGKILSRIYYNSIEMHLPQCDVTEATIEGSN